MEAEAENTTTIEAQTSPVAKPQAVLPAVLREHFNGGLEAQSLGTWGQIVRGLLCVTKPYRGRVHLALALTLLWSLLTPLPSVLQKYLIDWSIAPEQAHLTLTISQRLQWLGIIAVGMVVAICIAELTNGC